MKDVSNDVSMDGVLSGISREDLARGREEFEKLLEESLSGAPVREGRVARGRVSAVEGEYVVVDVGMKTEGRVLLQEFEQAGEATASIGDEVEVYVERVENALGEAVLSREKARRERAWSWLEEAYEGEKPVEGRIEHAVKGGFMVNLRGAMAFLPRSQADVRPVRDATSLSRGGESQGFMILKMDRRRGNVVVSRRSVLEEEYAERRSEMLKELAEGDVRKGVVKNITDYGAFVDLGGVDGLLHVADISWTRVGHPAEVVSVGDEVEVKVVRVNRETRRISLGMKQLQPDPWENVPARYLKGERFKGRVTNVTDYGAFVELEAGVEGLVHVTEMSWLKKGAPPSRLASTGSEVDVMVLEVDLGRRRISLGMKQCEDNPWEAFLEGKPEGSVVKGVVSSVTDFGVFVKMEGVEDLDGLVHMSDLVWEGSASEALSGYESGQEVEARVLRVDPEKERVSLGIKHMDRDPFEALKELTKGKRVTCVVTGTREAGVEVNVRVGDTEVPSFIKRGELGRDRSEQDPGRFAEGDKVDAKVMQVDAKGRKLSLSVKGLEEEEEREAMKKYGSADSGASLGDILQAAYEEKESQGEDEGPAEAEAKGEEAEAKGGESEAKGGESEAGLDEKVEGGDDMEEGKKEEEGVGSQEGEGKED